MRRILHRMTRAFDHMRRQPALPHTAPLRQQRVDIRHMRELVLLAEEREGRAVEPPKAAVEGMLVHPVDGEREVRGEVVVVPADVSRVWQDSRQGRKGGGECWALTQAR